LEYHDILREALGRDEYLVVGTQVARVDALDKALGRARYTPDYIPPGTRVVKVFRSSQAHALVKAIHTEEALKAPGVEAVYTALDVTGENQIGYALPDQPFLNHEKVHYVGDPLALVVARDEYSAQEALDLIEVDYQPLPAHLDVDSALAPGAEPIHPGGNIAVTTRIRKGDAEKGFQEADVEVRDTYETPYQEHAYLETEAAYAVPEGRKVTVVVTGQSPFLTREKVAKVLGWNLNQVRVIQPLTGGAFGGKDDQGPLVAAYAAFAAVKLGKPVGNVWTRQESLAYSNKRFPARIDYRSGANKEGKVTAIQVEITLECGAYANRAPFWLWRQTAHAAGPYEVENCWVDGRAVYTNKVYGGSFRGFGDVAMHFAAELQMDKLAEELGMDPVEFRLKNVLRVGSRTTCDQLLDHSVGMAQCLEAVRDASQWHQRRKPVQQGGKVRGVGVGLAYHGISTSRSTPDWSAASLLLNQDGTLNYRTGIVELGQGSPMGHIKIVSEITGITLDRIVVDPPDTDSSPNSKPTHGSRGLMLGGTAAADAALKLRRSMVACASELLGIPEDRVELRDNRAYERGNPGNGLDVGELAEEMYARGYQPGAYGFFKAPKRFYDPETGLGVNYSVYTFAASVAEVEVDTETGVVSVTHIWPAMDCGKAIDPLMVEGQIEGAIGQGLGFALTENLEIGPQGQVLNDSLTDYVIPCSLDTPQVEPCIIVEEPYKYGAFGAKGVGEPAIISVVPAIVNAVHHATGLWFNKLPLQPWVVHKALKEAGA